MARFNLSLGRYSPPSKSKYAEFTNSRYKDSNAVDNKEGNFFETPERHGTYGALLFHPKWRLRRKEILDRDNHACVICASQSNLEVHHRQYHFIINTKEFKPPWDYDDHLMITLCNRCHQRGHSKYKVPTINI